MHSRHSQSVWRRGSVLFGTGGGRHFASFRRGQGPLGRSPIEGDCFEVKEQKWHHFHLKVCISD